MPAHAPGTTPEALPSDALRLGRLALDDLAWRSGSAHVRVSSLQMLDARIALPTTPATGIHLPSLQASSAQLRGVEISFTDLDTAMSRLPASASWRLEALDALEGRIEAFITDAHWALDADVTLHIDGGRVDFNRATVEHIGPDSSMGLSPMGLYVDAPNGRTYLYLFNSTRVPGASFERRGGSLFGERVADRGGLQLRPLVEALLAGITLGAPAHAVDAQLDRTRLAGMLQLGNGAVGAGPHELMLEGSGQGRNRISLTAEVVGQSVIARLPEFSASRARFEALGKPVSCERITASLSIRLEQGSLTLVADEISLAQIAVGDPAA